MEKNTKKQVQVILKCTKRQIALYSTSSSMTTKCVHGMLNPSSSFTGRDIGGMIHEYERCVSIPE